MGHIYIMLRIKRALFLQIGHFSTACKPELRILNYANKENKRNIFQIMKKAPLFPCYCNLFEHEQETENAKNVIINTQEKEKLKKHK